MNKLLINNIYIEILCEKGDFETLNKALQVPYIHINRTKTKFRTSICNIDVVLKLFRGIDEFTTHLLPDKIRAFYEKEMNKRVALKRLMELGPQHDVSTIHGGKLERHQQLAVEIAAEVDRYAFFYSTRTGKTIMSLKIIEEDIKKNPTHRWLVLCPLILIENAWLEDLKFFPNIKTVVLHDKDKRKRIEQFGKSASLYIGNIESFIGYNEYYNRLKIHGCFVDESSTMKSYKAKFSKAAVEFAHTISRWYLLSGTPAPNCEDEYYMQLQSVDMYSLPQSRTQFKEHFFVNTSYNQQFEKLMLKADKKEEFTEVLAKYSIFVDKESVMETPGKEFIEYTMKLPEELQKSYDKLKKDLFVELSGTEVTASSSAAALNKLNQVTSGFLMDTWAKKENKLFPENDPLQEIYELSDYRFVELEKILDTLGDKQVVIWAQYRKEFEVIKQRLGDKCACVYGAVGIAEKNESLKKFKSGQVQYLVANPASASTGLTLTNANHCIYFSLGYSLELWIQSGERIYGGIRSQPNKCYYYIMLAEGTVDELIYKAVQGKYEVSFDLLDHLRGEWLNDKK